MTRLSEAKRQYRAICQMWDDVLAVSKKDSQQEGTPSEQALTADPALKPQEY